MQQLVCNHHAFWIWFTGCAKSKSHQLVYAVHLLILLTFHSECSYAGYTVCKPNSFSPTCAFSIFTICPRRYGNRFETVYFSISRLFMIGWKGTYLVWCPQCITQKLAPAKWEQCACCIPLLPWNRIAWLTCRCNSVFCMPWLLYDHCISVMTH